MEEKTSTTHIVNGIEIYLDGFLKKKLDMMKRYQQKDFDVVFCIDGKEGSGKSTLALTIAWYLSEGTITSENICEGSYDAMQKLDNLPNNSVIIIDEGSLVLSAKDFMTQEQRRLIKVLNVIRQKNMILIIVAPSFFDLNKYIAHHRSKCLIHVYSKGFDRGRFSYYGEARKDNLYLLGKKNNNNYLVTKPSFRGRFTDIKLPFHEEYLEQKRKSLREAFEGDVRNEKEIKLESSIEIFKNFKENCPELTLNILSKGFGVSTRTLSRWNEKINAQKKGGVGFDTDI